MTLLEKVSWSTRWLRTGAPLRTGGSLFKLPGGRFSGDVQEPDSGIHLPGHFVVYVPRRRSLIAFPANDLQGLPGPRYESQLVRWYKRAARREIPMRSQFRRKEAVWRLGGSSQRHRIAFGPALVPQPFLLPDSLLTLDQTGRAPGYRAGESAAPCGAVLAKPRLATEPEREFAAS